MLDNQDEQLAVLLATSSASLADAPGDQDNWIERAGPGGRKGQLPRYVRKIARAIMKTGKSKSQAIAIAISRIKRWAAGGEDVNADTRAKAAAALAQWEALKAKNAAKKVVKASHLDGSTYLILSDTSSFNTDIVRRAWSNYQEACRDAEHAVARTLPAYGVAPAKASFDWGYVDELWTDHIVVAYDSGQTYKVSYSVGPDNSVSFGAPVAVRREWVEVDDDDLTTEEALLLADLTGS